MVALLEGVSYLALLFFAMPLKYIWKIEIYVQTIGMAHGILFIIYIILAIFLYQKKKKWNRKDFLIILAASILPIGTFVIDKKYLQKQ
tara:strand:+ start:1410 stop:1673 length:264 start_codon:yes stop_codon:yes gene_type:complete